MSTKKINLIEHFVGNKSDILKDIKKILLSDKLTNNGPYHKQLIVELAKALKLKHSNLDLACNGTMCLILAAKAIGLNSNVIVSPYTFPATINFLNFLNIEPIFCDIDMDTLCINHKLIPTLLNNKTTGIVVTNVYGNYPNYADLSKIAKKNNLKIISDSSHALLQRIDNKSIFEYGDVSIASLHASKLLNTIEGGLIYFKNKKYLKTFQYLKNFGIKNEESVLYPGINGKLNEIQSAIGLNNLSLLSKEIEARKKIKDYYLKFFNSYAHKDISLLLSPDNISLQYLPVLLTGSINKRKKRDLIYDELKRNNILSRKYFYPLTSNYIFNKSKSTAKKKNLPVANFISENVLCLPFHGKLLKSDVNRIVKIIQTYYRD